MKGDDGEITIRNESVKKEKYKKKGKKLVSKDNTWRHNTEGSKDMEEKLKEKCLGKCKK